MSSNRLELFYPQRAKKSAWIPSLSSLAGMCNSVMNNLAHISPLRAFLFVVACQTLIARAQPMPEGVVAYFPFNSNTLDESDNDNDCISYGVTFVPDRFGLINSAAYFDGESYCVGDASPFPHLDRTVALWFKVDIFDNDPGFDIGGALFSYGGKACEAGQSFLMDINNKYQPYPGSFETQAHCNLTAAIYYNEALLKSPSYWTHMAMTTSAAGTFLYLNGTQVASNEGQMNTYVKARDFGIGAMAGANNGKVPYRNPGLGFFKGVIDDVYVVNRALKQSEIQSLYEQQPPAPPEPVTPPRPAAWYERASAWIPGVATLLVTGCLWNRRRNAAPVPTTHNHPENYGANGNTPRHR